MTSIQAIILGLVQGITEFFPISSSAHLILVPWLFGWQLTMSLDLEKTFDVALHLGTFVAILVLMRADVWRLLKALFGSIRRLQDPDPGREARLVAASQHHPRRSDRGGL